MLTSWSKLALLMSLVCLVTAPDLAGSCAPGVGSARDHMAAHDAVFAGRVLEIRMSKKHAPSGGKSAEALPGVEVIFEVKVAWKGVHDPRIMVVNHPVFAAPFELGVDFLVFAKRLQSDSRLIVFECGETKRLDLAADDVRTLGQPEYRPASGTKPANNRLKLPARGRSVSEWLRRTRAAA